MGEALPDEPFVQLDNGKGYESETESGPTAELVLDEEDLIGLPDTADKEEAPRVARSPTRAATAAATVETGAAVAKKKTAAQERKEEDDAKWTQLRTDGTETRVFGRPEFRPFKEGKAPTGFQFDATTHEKGGIAPGIKLSPQDHPAKYVAQSGWDKQFFEQMWSGTNEYAAAKGAGSENFYKTYKPFAKDEIVACFGLLLRNGVAPVPQLSLMFADPQKSFAFGDERVRSALPGEGCGGPAARFTQFRSFAHIQGNSTENWRKTDPATGKFVPLHYSEKTKLNKLEPMLSYMRYCWEKNWRAGKNIALDEMTIGFKGRCALVTRIKYKKEGDGFQCDCICEDGYCFTFWFRCDLPPRPAPADVSERDNRCAWLVERLPGMWVSGRPALP